MEPTRHHAWFTTDVGLKSGSQMVKLKPFCAGLYLATLTLAAVAGSAVPKEAQALIAQVHAAARNKNSAALEKLMVKDFVWSFGGDADAKQALTAWQQDTVAFKLLYRVTGSPCAVLDKDLVECPSRAATNYRAGFKKTDIGWRMIYFVAGD